MVEWCVSATTKPGLPPPRINFGSAKINLPVVQAEQTINNLLTRRSGSPIARNNLLNSNHFPILLPAAISKHPIGLSAEFTESSKQHNSGARRRCLDGTVAKLLLCVPPLYFPQTTTLDPIDHFKLSSAWSARC